MLPYSFIGAGTYTNPATIVAQNIALSDMPDWFFVKDITNWGAQSTAANPVYAEWFSSMAPGSYLGLGQPSSTTTGVTPYNTSGTTNGFTYINGAYPPTYSALAATAINDSTFVVSMSNTGNISVGDVVRVINPVGMQQIGGQTFQVTAVTANTSITLGYLASAVSAGLTISASATGASILKLIPKMYYPRLRNVLYITQANQAVVYFGQPNDFTPGELVDFNIPVPYGMTQLSFLTGKAGGYPGVFPGAARVLSVTNSATVSSITINVNTTGFTPFVYPASANVAGGASPATCFPAGSGVVPLNGSPFVPVSPPGTNLLDAFDNRTQNYMNIGTSAVGIASAVMQWFAFKADYHTLTNA